MDPGSLKRIGSPHGVVVGNRPGPYISCKRAHSNKPPAYKRTLEKPNPVSCLHFFSGERSSVFSPYTIMSLLASPRLRHSFSSFSSADGNNVVARRHP